MEQNLICIHTNFAQFGCVLEILNIPLNCHSLHTNTLALNAFKKTIYLLRLSRPMSNVVGIEIGVSNTNGYNNLCKFRHRWDDPSGVYSVLWKRFDQLATRTASTSNAAFPFHKYERTIRRRIWSSKIRKQFLFFQCEKAISEQSNCGTEASCDCNATVSHKVNCCADLMVPIVETRRNSKCVYMLFYNRFSFFNLKRPLWVNHKIFEQHRCQIQSLSRVELLLEVDRLMIIKYSPTKAEWTRVKTTSK